MQATRTQDDPLIPFSPKNLLSACIFQCFNFTFSFNEDPVEKKAPPLQCVILDTCSSSIITEWRKNFLMLNSNSQWNTISSRVVEALHLLYKLGLDRTKEGKLKWPSHNVLVKADDGEGGLNDLMELFPCSFLWIEEQS